MQTESLLKCLWFCTQEWKKNDTYFLTSKYVANGVKHAWLPYSHYLLTTHSSGNPYKNTKINNKAWGLGRAVPHAVCSHWADILAALLSLCLQVESCQHLFSLYWVLNKLELTSEGFYLKITWNFTFTKILQPTTEQTSKKWKCLLLGNTYLVLRSGLEQRTVSCGQTQITTFKICRHMHDDIMPLWRRQRKQHDILIYISDKQTQT